MHTFIKTKGLIFLVVFILISLLLQSCEKDNSVEFPSSLKGTWVTDELKYKNRYIDIDELAITLGTGKGTSNTLLIDKIIKKNKKPMVEWIFLCKNREGASIEFVIIHNSDHDGNLLYLRNMKKIKWRKVEY
ncbi:MAG: hypothetical protein PF690_09495 [Deltaproteobacteria bacterium]|jgi:hypothetical protein|nr:hypothetical protein [Deltaproteobacteria bacterium]